jgi:hypothetical protein
VKFGKEEGKKEGQMMNALKESSSRQQEFVQKNLLGVTNHRGDLMVFVVRFAVIGRSCLNESFVHDIAGESRIILSSSFAATHQHLVLCLSIH